MRKNSQSFFNNKGRLSQTDFALKTTDLSDPVIAIKSKYLRIYPKIKINWVEKKLTYYF
jgi:hypothetical protein